MNTFFVIVIVTLFSISTYFIHLKFITWGFLCADFINLCWKEVIGQFQLETICYLDLWFNSICQVECFLDSSGRVPHFYPLVSNLVPDIPLQGWDEVLDHVGVDFIPCVDPRWSYQCPTPLVGIDNDGFIILLFHISQFIPCLVHGGSIWKTISKFKQELTISAFVTCHDNFTYHSSGLLYDFSSKIASTHSACLVNLIDPILKLLSICSIMFWLKQT